MTTNGDPEGHIFLSHLHTNNFFLLTIEFLFRNKPPEVPEYAELQCYMMVTLTSD